MRSNIARTTAAFSPGAGRAEPSATRSPGGPRRRRRARAAARPHRLRARGARSRGRSASAESDARRAPSPPAEGGHDLGRVALGAAAVAAHVAVEKRDRLVDDVAHVLRVAEGEPEERRQRQALVEDAERRARHLDVERAVARPPAHAQWLDDAGVLDGGDERLGHPGLDREVAAAEGALPPLLGERAQESRARAARAGPEQPPDHAERESLALEAADAAQPVQVPVGVDRVAADAAGPGEQALRLVEADRVDTHVRRRGELLDPILHVATL